MPRNAPVIPGDIWKPCIDTWFEEFKIHFGKTPLFIGAAPKSLQSILKAIRVRLTEMNILWTRETAVENLKTFLRSAWDHSDIRFRDNIRQNYSLPFLLYNFDKITIMNGKPQSTFQRFSETIRSFSAEESRIPGTGIVRR